MNEKKEIYKKSIALFFVTIFCQIVNLIRDIVLASKIGTGSANDIYLTAQTIVSIMISMVCSPLATAYLPVATPFFVRENKAEKKKFLGKVYGDIMAIGGVFILLAFLCSNLIIYVIAPGFSQSNQQQLKIIFLLQLPMVFANIIRGLNRGNFQILQKYNISELTNILPYIFMVVYILVTPYGISNEIIAVVLSCGALVSLIIEAFVLNRYDALPPKILLAFDKDIKQISRLMLGASVVTVIREVNVLCDKSIGSLLVTGSITRLSYASKLTVVMFGVISTVVSTVGFSNIAKWNELGESEKIRGNIRSSCNLINYLLIPIAFYMILFSNEIITFFFGRGEFGAEDIKITSQLIRLYAIGLVGYGFQDVFTRSLHAIKIIKCTLIGSGLIVAINIVLNLSLYKIIGVNGLAIASSIAVLVSVPYYYSQIKKYIGDIYILNIVQEIIKVTISSLVFSVVVYFGRRSVEFNNMYLEWLVWSLVAMAIFIVCTAILRVSTMKEILELIKTKVSKRNR